jgi:hypothetical protein
VRYKALDGHEVDLRDDVIGLFSVDMDGGKSKRVKSRVRLETVVVCFVNGTS